jgi:hypothetical protein
MKSLPIVLLSWFCLSLNGMENTGQGEYLPTDLNILITQDVAGFITGELVSALKILDLHQPTPQLVRTKFNRLYSQLCSTIGPDHPHSRLILKAGISLGVAISQTHNDSISIKELMQESEMTIHSTNDLNDKKNKT